jgi:hypothetical protein
MTLITVSNPKQLKDIVLDVLRKILKAAIKELLAPEEDETAEARRERMRALIQEDFDRHEVVFKALA